MFEEIQELIPQLLKKAIQEQLRTTRLHKTFDPKFRGQNKTVGGQFGPFNSPPFATGNLYRSVNVYWETDIEDGDPNLIVDFGESDYWYWVDFGRKPGEFPNLDSIKKWIKDKPIGQWPGVSPDSQAYLIGRSIQRTGWGGTNFMDKAWNSVAADFENPDGPIGQYVFEYIDKLIGEGRILGRSNFNR
jgi:hypothetical protein